MSNTENPTTENPAVEQDDEGEDSSGLKVRTSLKAGLGENMLGVVGVRGGIRTDGIVASYSFNFTPSGF